MLTHETFTEASKNQLDWLARDYHCEVNWPEAHDDSKQGGSTSFYSVEYSNDKVTVILNLNTFRNVPIMKLVTKEKKKRIIHVENLSPTKSNPTIETVPMERRFTETEVERAIADYSEILRNHGMEVINGDYSSIDRLESD